MDAGRLIAADAGGSYVVAMLIAAAIGAAAIFLGVALLADVRETRSGLARRFGELTGLPSATFVLPLRLFGGALSSLGLVIAGLALTNVA